MPTYQNPNSPDFLFQSLQLDWLMSRWEKYAFDAFLRWLRPQLAIEVGTFRGGSLQVLASHSTKVVSLDISDEPRRALCDKFSNVSFQVGDSKKLLPELIQSVNEGTDVLQFVLIDGDHSTDGVRADIESVLQVQPRSDIYVIMHDSFHPPCREGMLSAAWSGCPFVHYLELDFVPGVYFREGNENVAPGSMYGGFALAKLLPEERRGALKIEQVHLGLYEACLNDAARRGAAEMGKMQRPERSTWDKFKRAIRF